MLAPISTTEAPAKKTKYSAKHPAFRLLLVMFVVIYSIAFWLLILMITFYLCGIHESKSFFFNAALVIALLVYSALALIRRGTHTYCTQPFDQ
jgi:amino acid permease